MYETIVVIIASFFAVFFLMTKNRWHYHIFNPNIQQINVLFFAAIIISSGCLTRFWSFYAEDERCERFCMLKLRDSQFERTLF
jgi:hypothetical protein